MAGKGDFWTKTLRETFHSSSANLVRFSRSCQVWFCRCEIANAASLTYHSDYTYKKAVMATCVLAILASLSCQIARRYRGSQKLVDLTERDFDALQYGKPSEVANQVFDSSVEVPRNNNWRRTQQHSKELRPQEFNYVLGRVFKKVRIIAAEKVCTGGVLVGKMCRVEVEVPSVMIEASASAYLAFLEVSIFSC